MKILKKNQLDTLWERLARNAELYLPTQKGDQSGFFSYKTLKPEKDTLMLDALNVYLSPKNIVLPQTEMMYSFTHQGQEINLEEVYEDPTPRIIFGLRSCDVKSIDRLDTVFFTRGFVDEYYRSRRENTLLILNACYHPGPNCFCEAMGLSPRESESADIILHDAGEEGYIWVANTEKGRELTGNIEDILEEKEISYPQPRPFTREVDYTGVAEKLKDMFSHPIWHPLSDPCINCGICTYVCPNCYCFDIQVKTRGEEGYRYRCWDSCMYGEYTMMAGGHNPRETGMERFRNRFLHKLEFFTERYGEPLCTGCGRCIAVCPTGINIIEIMEKAKGVEPSA